jgi:hypothetical protein
MDLKTFLLLPLTYVESVWKCLNVIKEKTNKSNSDYIPINTVLQSLETYVKKSQLNLTKFSLIDNQSINSSGNEILYSDNDESIGSGCEEEEGEEEDSYDFSKLNSKFLIYSSKLNYRLLKKDKWNKVSVFLLN